MIVTLWKCRLCGAFVKGPANHDTAAAELAARIASPMKGARISTHPCGSALAVTDLVAATDVTDVTKETD